MTPQVAGVFDEDGYDYDEDDPGRFVSTMAPLPEILINEPPGGHTETTAEAEAHSAADARDLIEAYRARIPQEVHDKLYETVRGKFDRLGKVNLEELI